MALSSLLLVPVSASDSEPPGPSSVTALVSPDLAVVSWVPPVMSPEELQAVEYRVYGVQGDTLEELGNATWPESSAVVAGGFEMYAVAVVLGGEFSVPVKACFYISTNPPGVQRYC